ncbi:condensation domain-containing protein [Streptomyces sp. NPDC059679]|uniref:condensation domain-containing protein n=1 Tax=Streptomyces sp. NPDC059679 TaxID=3346903 RepID=UPI00369CE1E0
MLSELAALYRQLSGGTEPELPRGVKSYRGASVDFGVPLDVLTRLRQLSQEHGGSLYMTLLSAFAALLGGRTDHREVAIGSPVSHRPRAELEGLVGYFVNTLVIRLDIAADRPFTELPAQGPAGHRGGPPAQGPALHRTGQRSGAGTRPGALPARGSGPAARPGGPPVSAPVPRAPRPLSVAPPRAMGAFNQMVAATGPHPCCPRRSRVAR